MLGINKWMTENKMKLSEKILTWAMFGSAAMMLVFTTIGLIVIDKGEFHKPAPQWINMPFTLLACIFLIALFWMLIIWLCSKQAPAGQAPENK